MFDVSWGELFVLTAVGIAFVGKRDLPRLAGAAGKQVGKLVGTLQGARARADHMIQQNELRQLQQELQSGLRELDAVRSELATAVAPSRSLMSTTRHRADATPSPSAAIGRIPSKPIDTARADSVKDPTTRAHSSSTDLLSSTASISSLPSQSIAAVAQAEWEKQGIGFISKAEQGIGQNQSSTVASGSALLANIYQENLIWDQHDRVVQEQDEVLQSKLSKIQQKVKDEQSTDNRQ